MKGFPGRGVVCLALIAALAAHAQRGDDEPADEPEAEASVVPDDYLDRTPVKCISLSRLRETEVVDNRTVLFYQRGRDAYVNVLDRECFGLKRAGAFITQTRSDRLCSVDMIQVYRQFAGRGEPGTFCGLGEFYPISRDEAELLELDPEERQAVQDSVVLTPIDPDELDEPAEAEAETDGDVGAGAEVGSDSEQER